MMRRLVGSVLFFEAIVIVLAIPVAINVAKVDPAPALIAGLGLAVAAVVVGARVDRPGGVAAGWVIQALVVASGLIVPTMAVLGLMFAALYYGALRLVASVAEAPVEEAAPVADEAGEESGAPADATSGEQGRPADATSGEQGHPAEATSDEPAPPASH